MGNGYETAAAHRKGGATRSTTRFLVYYYNTFLRRLFLGGSF